MLTLRGHSDIQTLRGNTLTMTPLCDISAQLYNQVEKTQKSVVPGVGMIVDVTVTNLLYTLLALTAHVAVANGALHHGVVVLLTVNVYGWKQSYV